MNWDPFQREVLAELGHVVYRQAGTPVANAAGVVLDTTGTQSPMLIHLARAASMSTEALQACISDTQVIVAGLHGNASAKRALWPRLRALRRQHS